MSLEDEANKYLATFAWANVNDEVKQLWRRKEYAPAITLLDEFIAKFPDHAMSYITRGSLRFNTGDTAGSLSDTARAIDIRPIPEFYIHRGELLVKMKRYTEAKKDFDEALERVPLQNGKQAYLIKAPIAATIALQFIGRSDELFQRYSHLSQEYTRLGQEQGIP